MIGLVNVALFFQRRYFAPSDPSPRTPLSSLEEVASRCPIPGCIRWVAPVLLLAPAARCPAGDDVGPLVRSLWLVQRFGTAEAVAPGTIRRSRGRSRRPWARRASSPLREYKVSWIPRRSRQLAGGDGKLDAAEVRKALDADVPESRKRLSPKVAAHADLLTTSFDMIDEPHREAGETLADWIAGNYKPGQPLHVTVVCTGNSRRSILGRDDGQRRRRLLRDARGPLPQRRHRPDRLQPPHRSPACKEIGVEIEPTGTEAPRGEPKTANPIYTGPLGRAGSRPGDDRVLEDLLRPEQPPVGLRRPDGLRRGRRRLPVRQGGGPAGLDAVPRPEDLRRQPVRGGQVRRAA